MGIVTDYQSTNYIESLSKSFTLVMLFLLILVLGATSAKENKTRHYYTTNGLPLTSLLQYGSTNLGLLGYQGNGAYPLYANYPQQVLANQNPQSSFVQVPQTGVVSASNLASTYGLGNYGTYGSSLPFLPSVFYRTRTRLAATEEGENATSTNQ